MPPRPSDGQFFALPQSPQLFKQMLMVAGYDRYYQIVKCFRDEDLRADRQPEFTQVDIETSFLTEAEITAMMEEMIRTIFREVLAVELPALPAHDLRRGDGRFGSDKPDLRVTLELTDVTDAVADVAFKVFSGPATSGGRVAAMRVPAAPASPAARSTSTPSSSASTAPAASPTSRSTTSPRPNESGLQSPIVKNLHETALRTILERTGAQSGDLIFFGADKTKVVNDALGALRIKLGHEKGYVNGKAWEPLWVVDFPMFEYDEDDKRWTACHHPFTSPKDEHLDLLTTDRASASPRPTTWALNGWKSVAARCVSTAPTCRKRSSRPSTSAPRSSRPSSASCSTPSSTARPARRPGLRPRPHRHHDDRRRVHPRRDRLPKTQRAQCLLTNAPSPVDEKQLRELHIRLRQKAPEAPAATLIHASPAPKAGKRHSRCPLVVYGQTMPAAVSRITDTLFHRTHRDRTRHHHRPRRRGKRPNMRTQLRAILVWPASPGSVRRQRRSPYASCGTASTT